VIQVEAFVGVKEIPIKDQVMNRLMGNNVLSHIGFNMNSVAWTIGFDDTKSFTWKIRFDNLFLYDDWQVKFVRMIVSNRDWSGIKGSFPFRELEQMNNGAGIIGTGVCAKLCKDFSDYHDKAKQIGNGFYEDYLKFSKRFKIAAEYQGIVIIHSELIKVNNP
jgi:hypothetical protein